jgi:hypothetical protein
MSKTMSSHPELDGASPPLPKDVGPISAAVIAALRQDEPSPIEVFDADGSRDVLTDDDFQLALYVCYELSYRGFQGVAAKLEWDPEVLTVRRRLEQRFLGSLCEAAGPPMATEPVDIDRQLFAILDESDVPGMPRYLETRATIEQFVEYVIHRSAYQLKEADPHSWVIPRMYGSPKAALLEIQADEYGNGSLSHMHSELFAQTMRELDLDDSYGSYLIVLPGVTLATVNALSMFGLHRRWRGALVGHLAAFEMGSSLPNRRYSNGLARLGGTKAARAFYDVHVLADAAHECVAAVDMAGGLAKQQPALAGDILFGARALAACEARFFTHLLTCWGQGQSSLREVSAVADA